MSTHSNKDYDGATEAPFYQLCTDCHDPHPTSNDALIRTSIGSLSVRLHAQSGADSYDDGFDDVEHDSICVVCHTATDHNKNTSTELRDDGHNPVGTDCIGCHPHGDEPSTRSGFMPTEGDCLACHSSAQAGRRQIVDDQQDGTGSGGDFIRGSHHVQPVTGTVTAADCVTCHDTSQHQGGSVRLIDPDDAGNVIVYTDGASVESFCVNCHDANGAAGNTTPFSDGKTVPPMPAGWASSAHKTSAGSPLTCLGDGTTGCHSNGHGSNLTPLLAPADGSPGPGNVNEEEGFCFACHDADGPASDDIESLFAKPSQHSVDGADGAQLECTNCHNPHNATDAAPLADPDSPAALWTGNERDFCLRCHDGAPPPAVVFPAAAPGTGWDKSATVGTTHDNNLSGMCTSCHEPHGVDYESLLLGRYDRVYQSYAPAEYGLCWNCHDEQAVVQNDNAFGNKHTRHVVNVESPCIFCHDTHVPYDAGESGLIDYGHAVDHAGDFLLSWGSHSYDLSSSFVDTGQNTGTCSLKCHGKPHNAVSYSGEEVTATLTATATPTGTPTNTSTPTATATNTATATATATNTATATATLTATTSPAATPTATATETPSPTSTSTPTPGTAEVSIDPPSQTVTGSTVSVDIAITDAADLGSYDIILTWDETLLSFLSVSNGSFLGSTGRTVNCPEPMTDTNIVSFSCSTTGADPGPNGNGLLATLQFSTISDGISPLTLSGVALTDTSGASLAVTTSDGTITVQSPTATNTPTPGDTPTVTATPTATTSPTPTPTATPTSTATATATATETPSPTPTTAAPTALPTATDENASDPGASHAGTLAVLGEAPGDSAGYALATGDINGDGKSDLIIGAPHADAGARDEAGKTYVIFGTTDLPPTVDLSRTTAGLVVSGPVSGGWSGFAVAAADLNGDGSDDLIIGAPGCWQCGSAANETYVIYGGGGLRSVIDLSSDSADVTIPGRALHDRSGSALATGDLNGDGTDDLIIGAPYAAAPAGLGAGATYVVFGGASLDSVMDLDASASFTVYGSSPNDHSASAVASGDFNGDGLDDLVVGAPGAATAGGAEAGEAYVIYGSPALSGTLDLNASRANVTITGGTAHELFGSTVAAGDVSADGRADLTIGAPGSDPAGRRDAGAVYVFREGSLLRDIDLGVTSADLVLMGDDDLDRAGHALAVGDASGDGISDLIVGASGADPTAGIGAGETYVIHGGSDLPSILDLASNPADLTVFGAQSGDSSGSALAAADINSDGLEDLVIGAPGAQPGGRHRAGAVYVVFSHWAARPTATPTATVTPTRTPVPTSTPTLEATSAPTSVPTRVATPSPTAIPAPQPTATATPSQTAIPAPQPTATATPSATAIPPSPPTAVSTPSPPGHARTSTASRSVYGGMSVAQWQVQEGAGELFFGQHLQVLLALLG